MTEFPGPRKILVPLQEAFRMLPAIYVTKEDSFYIKTRDWLRFRNLPSCPKAVGAFSFALMEFLDSSVLPEALGARQANPASEPVRDTEDLEQRIVELIAERRESAKIAIDQYLDCAVTADHAPCLLGFLTYGYFPMLAGEYSDEEAWNMASALILGYCLSERLLMQSAERMVEES